MHCGLQVLQFVHGVAAQLSDIGVPGSAEMGLQLFLTATHSSSEIAGLELITYEFFEQVSFKRVSASLPLAG